MDSSITQDMPLDLDILEEVCYMLDKDAALTMSITCKALRVCAIKQLLSIYQHYLRHETGVRRLHAFLSADGPRRFPYIRHISIHFYQYSELTHREDVSHLVADIITRSTRLRSLSLAAYSTSLLYLNGPKVSSVIRSLKSLRKLDVDYWCSDAEEFVRTTHCPLEVLWFRDFSDTESWSTSRLDGFISHLSLSLKTLNAYVNNFNLIRTGVQYPAMRSASFGTIGGPLRTDILIDMFPSLDHHLSIDGLLDPLMDDPTERQRLRDENQASQLHKTWRYLDHLRCDSLTFFVLALTCPVREIDIDRFGLGRKTMITESLRLTHPSDLRLFILISHGANIFDDLLPPEISATLTRLTLHLRFSTKDLEPWDEDGNPIESQTLDFMDLFNRIAATIRGLPLTHLAIFLQVMVFTNPIPLHMQDFVSATETFDDLDHFGRLFVDTVPTLQLLSLSVFGVSYSLPSSYNHKKDWRVVREDSESHDARLEELSEEGYTKAYTETAWPQTPPDEVPDFGNLGPYSG